MSCEVLKSAADERQILVTADPSLMFSNFAAGRRSQNVTTAAPPSSDPSSASPPRPPFVAAGGGARCDPFATGAGLFVRALSTGSDDNAAGAGASWDPFAPPQPPAAGAPPSWDEAQHAMAAPKPAPAKRGATLFAAEAGWDPFALQNQGTGLFVRALSTRSDGDATGASASWDPFAPPPGQAAQAARRGQRAGAAAGLRSATVPAGTRPRQQLDVADADGTLRPATIPAGVEPGMSFAVQAPSTMLERMEARHEADSLRTAVAQFEADSIALAARADELFHTGARGVATRLRRRFRRWRADWRSAHPRPRAFQEHCGDARFATPWLEPYLAEAHQARLAREAEAGAPADDLPANWIAKFDANSSRAFYVNSVTGEKTWNEKGTLGVMEGWEPG